MSTVITEKPGKPTLAARPGQKGIDPRGQRVSAGITAVLLLVVVALGLRPLTPTVAARATEPAFILFAIITLLFAWGAFAGVQRHPYGWLYKTIVRQYLTAPAELENPVPPSFAQGVGFLITLLGSVLHLGAVPYVLLIAASAAFIAAFLNSAFGYCLGCQIYLLFVRAGIFGTRGADAALDA